jgi:hypothetical protein
LQAHYNAGIEYVKSMQTTWQSLKEEVAPFSVTVCEFPVKQRHESNSFSCSVESASWMALLTSSISSPASWNWR